MLRCLSSSEWFRIAERETIMGRLVERLWRCYFWYWFLFFWLVTYLINKNSVCKQSPTWCVPLPCYLSLLVFRWIVKYRRCSGWKHKQTDRGKWSEHPITFPFLSHVCPDVKVIDIQSDLCRKRPRPVGDHFLKAKKNFPVKALWLGPLANDHRS